VKTPDLTPAQLLATLKAVLAVAVAFSVPLSSTQQVALLALAGTLSTVLVAADATIRRARAQHLAGALADQQAAAAIADAAAATRTRTTADTLANEAAAEAAAQAANDEAVGGVDPATLEDAPPA
jgi:hypothetical protein